MTKTTRQPKFMTDLKGRLGLFFAENHDQTTRHNDTWKGLVASGRSVEELLLTFMEVMSIHQDIEEYDPYLEWMDKLVWKSHDLLINGLRSRRDDGVIK